MRPVRVCETRSRSPCTAAAIVATRAFQGANDVQEIGVVALLLRRHAPGEALEAVAAAAFAQREAGGPCLVGVSGVSAYETELGF
jgi:hypothetical protein